LGKEKKSKDVDTEGVNPMPSGYVVNSSHLSHTRIYKAIFSTKLLQSPLPAVWHLTFPLSHPEGYVAVSGWQCTALNFQIHAHSTNMGSLIRNQSSLLIKHWDRLQVFSLLRINFISCFWAKLTLY
jgi:hypothetical protein